MLFSMKKILTLLSIASLSLFVFAWCNSKNKVQIGDTITMVYTATYPDGTIFDQNTEETPLMFIAGNKQVIEGLDETVVGMKVGKTKTVTITPDKWYGKLYQEQNIQKVGKLIFDTIGLTPEAGTIQKLDNIEGLVKGIETDEDGNEFVIFDINPRQTRENLEYKITILSKQNQ